MVDREDSDAEISAPPAGGASGQYSAAAALAYFPVVVLGVVAFALFGYLYDVDDEVTIVWTLLAVPLLGSAWFGRSHQLPVAKHLIAGAVTAGVGIFWLAVGDLTALVTARGLWVCLALLAIGLVSYALGAAPIGLGNARDAQDSSSPMPLEGSSMESDGAASPVEPDEPDQRMRRNARSSYGLFTAVLFAGGILLGSDWKTALSSSVVTLTIVLVGTRLAIGRTFWKLLF